MENPVNKIFTRTNYIKMLVIYAIISILWLVLFFTGIASETKMKDVFIFVATFGIIFEFIYIFYNIKTEGIFKIIWNLSLVIGLYCEFLEYKLGIPFPNTLLYFLMFWLGFILFNLVKYVISDILLLIKTFKK